MKRSPAEIDKLLKQKIKEKLEQANLSTYQVSRQLGQDPSTLRKQMKGNYYAQISLITINKICKVLNMNMSDMFESIGE